MEGYQIIAGFSDIKFEFRKKTRTEKTMSELRLWFSMEDEVLYVHDYDDHGSNMVLAVQGSSEPDWRIFLRKNSYGFRLTNNILESCKSDQIEDEINKKFTLFGNFIF